MDKQTELIIKWVGRVLLTSMLSGVALAQDRMQTSSQKPAAKPPQPAVDYNRPEFRKGMKPPSGPSFYIGPVEGSVSMFSILLGDGGGNTVSGSFTLQQLDVFEAVLEAARDFALTDEKVGKVAPITTRLMEQHEWSLFVDVSKIGDKSRFYISLITPQGKLTTAAGEITRGSKKEHSAMLLDVLSQVKNAKTGGRTSR